MTFVFILLAWVFSVCLHEFAHAIVAYYGGDTTVKDKGYLSLNPFKFSDPLLSVGLPVVFLMLGGLGLPGGAVYIEDRLIRSRVWLCAVSVAGPVANALLAVVLALPFSLGFVDPYTTDPVWQAYAFLIVLQIMAVVFNLIPVPPLDGFGAISAWFDYEFQIRARQWGRYGLFIIIVLFWNVPALNHGFWSLVFNIAAFIGVPPDVAWEGYSAFRII